MEPLIVDTKLGKYKGHYVETLGGRKVAAFNGIRYAKPPVQRLRFKEAEKVEAHEGVYEATKDGDDSVQENQNYTKYSSEEKSGKVYLGCEDCLFLNVYTPQVKPEKPYPVIVYLHGGGFYKGTACLKFHGPQLLLDKDVLLVTITYRLGILGFLSYEDVIPANLGLKDQSLALHWVKDHISCFGGDPGSITLMGHSAGSVCAELHMASPRNRGIIKRAITQSWSLSCPSSSLTQEEANEVTLTFASILKCPTNPTEILKSLQEKSVEEIMIAFKKLYETGWLNISPILLGPVIEKQNGGFITKEDLTASCTIPRLSGVTKDEGFVFYRENIRRGDENLSFVNDNYKEIFPISFSYNRHLDKQTITEKIKQFYFGQENISKDTAKQYVQMTSDGLIIHGVVETIRRYEGNSYLYILTHLGQRSLTNGLHHVILLRR